MLSNPDIFETLANNRQLFLLGEIDAEMATELAAQLLWLNSSSKTEEITLYINSPGGTIEDGLFTLYDTMQHVSAPIRTYCIGEAASAAAIILAAGSHQKRFAYPHAKIMIHAVQASDISGSQKEIAENSKDLKKLNRVLMEILARHTRQTMAKVSRDCSKDYWMTAQEALKYGVIDFIEAPSKRIPDLKTAKNKVTTPQ